MKKVIAGFIAGMIFATAGTALAQTAIEKITASVRTDYSVEVDGKKVELTNAPLAYNGSSYLPVREVSEMLGKEVDFKDGVIKLSTPIADPAAELERLEHSLEIDRNNIVKINEYLNNDNLTPNDKKNFEDAIKITEEAIAMTEKKISELLERYPELAGKK